MDHHRWITVLNIAHQWKFDNLKAAAIRELQKADIDIITRVELYQNNGVDIRYILPLYADLCQRNEKALTWVESKRVGLDATYAVMHARDIMSRAFPPVVVNKNEPPRSPAPSEIPRASIFGILKKVLELGDVEVEDHPVSMQGNPADANTQTVGVDPKSGSSTTPKMKNPPPGKNPGNPN
jgi:hypothetical protein